MMKIYKIERVIQDKKEQNKKQEFEQRDSLNTYTILSENKNVKFPTFSALDLLVVVST
jgi:hypothetical protein